MICTDSCFVDVFDLFCFCLDGPVGPERSLSKSCLGMATPELIEVDNDDNVVDIINCEGCV